MATLVRRSLGVLGAWMGAAIAGPYAVATFAVSFAGLIVASAFVTSMPLVTMLAAALICGWAEVDGACGASHVSALTPLRALDKTHRLWRNSVIAYTVGGVVTSLIVGALLGLATFAVRRFVDQSLAAPTIVLAIAIVLAARELRLLRFLLPQVNLQTQKFWALQFGHVTGAAMWGAHIGIGFATVIKHGGLYLVAACALMLGPLEGALLMSAFWVGRALPMWVTPLVVPREIERDGSVLLDLVFRAGIAVRGAALVGFFCFAIALVMR